MLVKPTFQSNIYFQDELLHVKSCQVQGWRRSTERFALYVHEFLKRCEIMLEQTDAMRPEIDRGSPCFCSQPRAFSVVFKRYFGNTLLVQNVFLALERAALPQRPKVFFANLLIDFAVRGQRAQRHYKK
eukprot:gnl/TRDRNA2_/TRDRNA2_214012_c0_seq1.p2 gnl/TRDRNA2_/TRDRNA2_214012_c0~~gnl/TRDRNA2_/TRDRNA2_214012_c0_seq1.p2  ORF type:complete len:129 (-),score=16.01 gnl/TRDRNA2_/TRDRNA2_214012_c0_seq1:32-418(-)